MVLFASFDIRCVLFYIQLTDFKILQNFSSAQTYIVKKYFDR